MGKIARRFVFPILIAFSSCCPPCNQWKIAVIKADCPPATITKAYLPACNPFSGMEAVVISSNGNIQFYLYALTLLFPALSEDCEHAEVVVCIEDNEFSFVSDRLQGGQCIRLPEEARDLIICALLEQKNPEITVGRYQACLTHDNFFKVYAKLPY